MWRQTRIKNSVVYWDEELTEGADLRERNLNCFSFIKVEMPSRPPIGILVIVLDTQYK